MHFPEKGGRKFDNKIWDFGFRCNMEDLLEFLFPSHKMPVFHKLGVEYLKFFLDAGKTTENGKKELCNQSGSSWLHTMQ